MADSYADYVHSQADEEYVQAVQELRRGSRTRPQGSLRGPNRQNTKRAAIERSRREHE